jgi:hypothetical protein
MSLYKQINLLNIKTFVYTIPANTVRQENVGNILTQLNFNWRFVFGESEKLPYWRNIHNDWVKILSNSVPFLILEDDVVTTKYFTPNISYPADADLVYLGGTINGELYYIRDILKSVRSNKETLMICIGSRDWWPEFMVYTERPDAYIRPYNMHSTHAVLFVNEDAKNRMSKILDDNSKLGLGLEPAEQNISVDRLFAENMRNFKVYCLKKPFFYQADGHNDSSTLFYYKGVPISTYDLFEMRLLKFAFYAIDSKPIEQKQYRQYNYTDFIDVTEKLNNIIKSGLFLGDRNWNYFKVCNEFIGCDPFPHHKKILILEYNSGANACWEEGKYFCL